VCDPRKPCPCPLFREKNVCTCAGERAPAARPGGPVRLTEHVRSAGCAGKIGQKDLHAVLARLPPVKDPRLLVGLATADDAGVFRLASGVTVVQTVDVFTPCVDDPYLFGRIAACNSLSDVYAMGGTPVTALSIIGFPIEVLPGEVMAEILRGGMDILKEAGVILVGGHSLNDEEIKFGLAVTGVVAEAAVVTNAGARPGDALILTKPLGTGIVTLAGQVGKAAPASLAAAAATMSTLNKAAAEIMARHHATACTDVTGFGFLGHLCRLVLESGVTAEIRGERLPLLPGVLDYAAQGIFSGANERNAEFSAAHTQFDPGVPEALKAVLFDAQTSGGLLIALPAAEAAATLRDLHAAGIREAAIVGAIREKSSGLIRVRYQGAGPTGPAALKNKQMEVTMSKKEKEKTESCCAHDSAAPDAALEKFQDFLGAAMAPGALDAVTKELLAVALGLAVHCVPCTKLHLEKAKKMGIGAAELEEAAALAIAFSGCRALMLWNEIKQPGAATKPGGLVHPK
jgi:selenide,water dikinase